MLKRFFKKNVKPSCGNLWFQTGLMLSEVLIVVAIILVLTLVVMVNHREGQKKVILERGAHKLAQDIRTAQEMAISGKEFDGEEPFGYGVFIKNTPLPQIKYILYADLIPSNDEIYSNPQELVENLELEKGLFIKEIEIDDIPGYNYTNIYFQSPDPIIKIKENNKDDDFDKVKITIALEDDDTRIKTVTVNTVGLIEISGNSSSPPPSGICTGGPIDCAAFGPTGICMIGNPCYDCTCPCSTFRPNCGDCFGICEWPDCSDLNEEGCNVCSQCSWSG